MSRLPGVLCAFLLVVSLAGCVRDDGPIVAAALRGATTPVRLAVAAGDSISTGFGADRGYVPRMAVLLDARVVFSGAVNGATASSMAAGQFRPDRMRWSSPDVVVIAIGTNDFLQAVPSGSYRRDLADLVRRTCGVVPDDARVLLIHMYALDADALHIRYPAEIPPGPREPWAAYGSMMAQVAASSGVGYLDLSDLPVQLGSDGVHPDGVGHQRIADAVAGQVVSARSCA